MPIPTNPTLLSIATEGIKQAGEANPSAALLTRAQNEWIEQIKNEIWHLTKKPKILQVTSYTIVNKGQSRYAFPADYSSDLFLTILWGSFTGVSQGGSINTLILATNDLSGNNVVGKEILMMSGTSQGSFSQVVGVNGANPNAKVASMVPDFNMAPSTGDTYMIIDQEYPVETRPIWDWDARIKMIAPGLPQYLYPVGDDQSGYFQFDKPPDFTRGARLRYYSDISQLDVSSTLMSVIYRKWRNIFIKGVKYRKLADEDDDLAEGALRDYNRELHNLIYREMYGMDISNLTDRVMDFDFGSLSNNGGSGGVRW
jgi:hypothetical protein